SLVEKLHRGLEESDFIYVIEGCPMFEVSLHVNTERLLKFFSEMARYQVERLFKHRTAFDGVDGIAFFQSPVQFLDQRAFSGAHGPHQVKNLPAFFSLERRRVKIAYDLGNGLFDPKE